jgi:adenine-specific DNA-methyltransferase
MIETDKLDGASFDVAAEKRADLLRLFPEASAEGGRVDIERLRLALGDSIETGKERYGLSWPGKADCFKTIQSPSMATLLPDREKSVNFETTENLIIEGDNLEVLKLLQKSYLGKIKMIYIDPPYNTGNDFIYPDDYSETLQTYLQYTKQVDAEGRRFGTNSDTEGRFHSNWLNMIFPRLYLARNLLRDDGVIFISIDDHEAASLRIICNEIFGEENFVAQFVWNTEGHTDNQFHVKVNHEYVLLYAKQFDSVAIGHIVDPNTRKESNLWQGFAENSITKNGPANPPSEVVLPRGFPCTATTIEMKPNRPPAAFYEEIKRAGYITRELTGRFSTTYPIRHSAMIVEDNKLTEPCTVFSGWANVDKLRAFIAAGCEPLDDGGDTLAFYLSANGVIYYRRTRDKARNILSVLRNMGTTERMRSELEEMGIPFQYPKPNELLKYLVQIGLDKEGIVLDFFAGSGTIAQSVFELNKEDAGNRHVILIQLPEPTGRDDYATIADILRERVRRVVSKADEANNGKLEFLSPSNCDLGFRVFALAESNVKEWDASVPHDVAKLEEQLALRIDHLRPDRDDLDILYEVILKSGYPLSAKVETKTICDQKAYSVSEGAFIICLERKLTLELIRAIAEHKPERVLFLDEAFAGNDQLKTNAFQTFKARDISFRTL